MYLNSIWSLNIFIISSHHSKVTFWNIVFIYKLYRIRYIYRKSYILKYRFNLQIVPYPIEPVQIVINVDEGDKIMIINEHSYFFPAKWIVSNEL